MKLKLTFKSSSKFSRDSRLIASSQFGFNGRLSKIQIQFVTVLHDLQTCQTPHLNGNNVLNSIFSVTLRKLQRSFCHLKILQKFSNFFLCFRTLDRFRKIDVLEDRDLNNEPFESDISSSTK